MATVTEQPSVSHWLFCPSPHCFLDEPVCSPYVPSHASNTEIFSLWSALLFHIKVDVRFCVNALIYCSSVAYYYFLIASLLQ